MILFTSIIQNSDKSWTFVWNTIPGVPYWRVILYGNQLAKITVNTYTASIPNYINFPPPIEVAQGDILTLSETYQPYIILQWYGEVCFFYLIQQYLNSSWTTIARVVESGQWIHTFQTAILPDEMASTFRIIAVDSLGNQSAPREFINYVVRPPNPPDGSLELSYSGGNVVISAAS